MMNKSGGMGIGCLVVIVLLVITGAAFIFFGPDLSIPWTETQITLLDNTSHLVYRLKGIHYARVRVEYGTSSNECYLPWRPGAGPVNVYYYSRDDSAGKVRLQDEWCEVLVDLQRGKTYLLVRTPDDQVFAGEILEYEVGSRSGSVNGGPWEVEIENRKAGNITDSGMVTNRGQYIGRIEVTDIEASEPPRLRFVSAGEHSEQPIKKRL